MNTKVVIDEITEIKKQPSDHINILTKYPLPKEKVAEYKQNKGTLTNNDNDICDFTTYIIKNYELQNEVNEKIELIEDGNHKGLQELSLWDYNNVLFQNLGIKLTLNKKFKTLNGYINIEFQMPGNYKKDVKIPVTISIDDKVSD